MIFRLILTAVVFYIVFRVLDRFFRPRRVPRHAPPPRAPREDPGKAVDADFEEMD